MRKPQSLPMQSLGVFAVITADMVGYSLVGLFMGYGLWFLGWHSLWVYVLTGGLGFLLAWVQIYRFSVRIQKQLEKQENASSARLEKTDALKTLEKKEKKENGV